MKKSPVKNTIQPTSITRTTRVDGVHSPKTWLDVLMDSEREGLLPALLAELSDQTIERMLTEWSVWARPDQWPPLVSDDDPAWTVWLVLGGRGAGKTRTGAEWVRGLVFGHPAFTARAVGRIALVGETHDDAREVMIEGVSGLLSVHPRADRPLWQPARRRIEWSNGAIAHVFSAEDPESLRGPQFEAAWLDEVGKWRQAEAVFDMLQFGLRLGLTPRQTITTTPRPTPLIKRLLHSPRTHVSRAKTSDNAYNLAPAFLSAIVDRYAGTRLGRQELDGEMIEERSDALWSRALLERSRHHGSLPEFERIVVAVDPPASSGRHADACGIIAAGRVANGSCFVIDDATIDHATPNLWAERALSLYHRLEADHLVVEVNQGGEMVETILHTCDHTVPVISVRATRGKILRAEPVAQLYEQGRVFHARAFPALEDELCDFGPTERGFGLSSGRSPDRMDALVWAITALMLQPSPRPRVRQL